MVFSQEALYSAVILLHHVMALVSLYTAIDIRSAHLYVLFGLFTEVTTPFVNLRWRLHEAGRADSRLYVVNGLAMTAVWGACRVVAFAPLFAHVYTHFGDSVRYLPTYALVVMLGVPLLLFFLNLAWFTKMVQGAAKMLRRGGGGGGAKQRRGEAAEAGRQGKGQHAQQQGKAQRGGGGGGAKRVDATVLVEAYAAAADGARKEE